MLKKLDSLLFYVSNVGKTVDFYRKIGFEQTRLEKNLAEVSLKSFRLQFIDQSTAKDPEFRKEATARQKGSGLYIYIEVEDIDEYHKSLLEKGLKPSGQPRNWPWGNREFVIRDPDGYKLVFHQPLK
jgi:catechol 2,3-dioxygenase-like lactoylglutathione lyase family enzyme